MATPGKYDLGNAILGKFYEPTGGLPVDGNSSVLVVVGRGQAPSLIGLKDFCPSQA